MSVLSFYSMAILHLVWLHGMLRDSRSSDSKRPISWILLYLLVSAGAILEASLLGTGPGDPYLLYSGSAAVLIYALGLIHLLYRTFQHSRTSRPSTVAVARYFLLGAFLILLLYPAVLITNWDPRFLIHAYVTGYLVVIYWFSLRYPNFLAMARLELQRDRYRMSGLGALDVSELIRKLNQLMTEERLFALENLTLGQLAEELEITSHQLSELLNSKLGRSFNNFVNEYRIEEACRMLIEEPDRSVVSIGVAVGFNSNSAFYKAFSSIKGISPAKYRKEK